MAHTKTFTNNDDYNNVNNNSNLFIIASYVLAIATAIAAVYLLCCLCSCITIYNLRNMCMHICI